jgi:hypothetical protein
MSLRLPTSAPSDLLLGYEAIGSAFNRSGRTAARWIKAGVIPYKRLPDGTHVTSLRAIAQWIATDESQS